MQNHNENSLIYANEMTFKSFSGNNKLLVWIAAWIIALLFPVFAYGILPHFNIEIFKSLLPFNRILLIPTGAILLLLSLSYLDFVKTKPPTIFVFFLCIFWQIISYYADVLLDEKGINLHLRPIIILLCTIPFIIAVLKFKSEIFRKLPYLKIFTAFLITSLFYYIFFNAGAVDLKTAQEGASLGGNMASDKITFYYLDLVGMVLCFAAFSKNNLTGKLTSEKLFDIFNLTLMIVTSTLSIIFVIGYPLNLFTVRLEGFLRSAGLLTQPNPYAHHLGLLILYFLGLFCYYQGENKSRFPTWLLYTGIGINLLGFLIGFSKSAILALGIALLVIITGNFSTPVIRKTFIWGMILFSILIVIGLAVFSSMSHQSIIDIFQARMDNNNSMDWRTNVWSFLQSDISLRNIFTGHGLTAANNIILQNSFSDKDGTPVIMVHNGYLELLYDYGIWGYTFIIAILAMIHQAIKNTFLPLNYTLKSLMYTIIAFCVYFLIVLSTDEILFMFDATHLFWYLCTILFCIYEINKTNHEALCS